VLAIAALAAACSKATAEDARVEVTAPKASTVSVPAPFTLSAPDITPETVLVIVNGTQITQGDVQKDLERLLGQFGGQIPLAQLREAMPEMRARAVEMRIMNTLVKEALVKEGVSLDDDEFEKVKEELANTLPPGVNLQDQMEKIGITDEELREQMAVRKLIVSRAEKVARPSDAEVEEFYNENKDYFQKPETVAASHILLQYSPTDTDESKAEKRAKIEQLRQDILGGADFAAIAKANSDCPSAEQGGSLGEFGRGQMVPEFDAAAFAQEVGTVGEIVETRFGLHLVLVTARNDAGFIPLADIRGRLEERIYQQKQEEAIATYMEELRSAGSIEILDADLKRMLDDSLEIEYDSADDEDESDD